MGVGSSSEDYWLSSVDHVQAGAPMQLQVKMHGRQRRQQSSSDGYYSDTVCYSQVCDDCTLVLGMMGKGNLNIRGGVAVGGAASSHTSIALGSDLLRTRKGVTVINRMRYKVI
jgi:hypothetical protein